MSSVSTRLPDNPPSTDRPNPERTAVFDWFVAHPKFEAVEWPTLIDGHPVGDSYCETYWLPVVGPTAYLAACRLTDWITDAGGEHVVDMAELGSQLGVGTIKKKRHSAIVRSLVRLHEFSMVRQQGDRLEVRLVWPDLPPRRYPSLTNSLLVQLEEFEANR